MQTQMHDMPVARLQVLLCSAMHNARSGNLSGEGLPAPGNYRTVEPEGKSSGFCRLEGGGGHTGSVSVFIVFF